MTETWKVEVPTGLSGSGGSGDSGAETGSSGGNDKSMDALNRGVKKLDKTMYLNLDVLEMLSSLLGDAYKMVRPLFKLLSIMFMLVFRPLLPLFKLLMQGLAFIIKMMGSKGDSFVGAIVSLITALLLAVLAGVLIAISAPLWAIVLVIVTAVLALWAAWKSFGEAIKEWGAWIGEKIMNFFKWLIEKVTTWVTDFVISIRAIGVRIKEGWDNFIIKVAEVVIKIRDFFRDVGTDLKEALSKSLDKLKGLGQMIKDKIMSAIDKVKGWFGGGKAAGGPVSGGTTYLVGEKGPELFTPAGGGNITPNNKMGGATININGPIVREDRDIKRIADEVSKVIERKLWRSG